MKPPAATRICVRYYEPVPEHDSRPMCSWIAVIAPFPALSLRRRAMRVCSVNSSMNPGPAAWLKCPPDSPNHASDWSYSANGEQRATGLAEPL